MNHQVRVNLRLRLILSLMSKLVKDIVKKNLWLIKITFRFFGLNMYMITLKLYIYFVHYLRFV